MSKLSEEQMTNLANIIECNGVVLLRCDGFEVSLSVGELTYFRPAKTINVVNVRVNGEINVKWCNYACEESKFLMPILVDGNKTLYQPSFFAARHALEHINAASDRIELLRSYTSQQWRALA